MQEFRIVKLHLQTPLYYSREDGLTFPVSVRRAGEYLFGFEIDAAQYRSTEPETASFIGEPFFRGRLSPTPPTIQSPGETIFTLEAGLYLFTQSREPTDWEGVLDMALEIQKEGLREGYALDRRLFLRCLFEDGMVTQIWRPVPGKA
jgi:hypothetical protein